MTTAPAKTPRLSGPQRREQILDATKELAGERGFHAISIDAVARTAGITRPVIYGHFSDLGGLLRALVEREGERATEQLLDLLPDPQTEQPAREVLIGALRAFLEAVRCEPLTWRLVLMPSEGAPAILRDRVTAVRGAVTEQLVALTPQVLAGSDLPPPPDPELTALSIQAFAEDAARLLLDRPREYPIDRLVAHAEWLLRRLGL